MNERIKELLEHVGGYGAKALMHPDDVEKFAELIVKECMRLNSKELSITAIERLLPLYKEHFGVEE